jgi:hypothetical protein
MTLDYEEVGRVARVAPAGFSIDGRFGRRLLSLNDVFTVSGHVVTLICNLSRFDDYAKPIGVPSRGRNGWYRQP